METISTVSDSACAYMHTEAQFSLSIFRGHDGKRIYLCYRGFSIFFKNLTVAAEDVFQFKKTCRASFFTAQKEEILITAGSAGRVHPKYLGDISRY